MVAVLLLLLLLCVWYNNSGESIDWSIEYGEGQKCDVNTSGELVFTCGYRYNNVKIKGIENVANTETV